MQQNSVSINQSHRVSLADKCNRRALHDRDAQLVGKKTHHGSVLSIVPEMVIAEFAQPGGERRMTVAESMNCTPRV